MFILLLALGACAAGCSRGNDGSPSGQDGSAAASSEESIARVQTAARALANVSHPVDYVAAQMEGVIKARTGSQALIHFDGYRATLTSPGSQVTRIEFVFADVRPTMSQLTKAFGTPEEFGRGWLYVYKSPRNDSIVQLLAEPVSMPATEDSPVRRIVIQG